MTRTTLKNGVLKLKLFLSHLDKETDFTACLRATAVAVTLISNKSPVKFLLMLQCYYMFERRAVIMIHINIPKTVLDFSVNGVDNEQ